MSDANRTRATFHNGAVVPDDWIPVVADGTPLPNTVVALYIGTGGGNLTAGMQINDGGNQRVFKNVANGQIIPGCFYNVTAVTGTVADILAGVVA